MKRAIIICWGLFFAWLPAPSQFGRIGGSIRYEHQYQDVAVRGALLTSLRRSPSINLSTKGSITSPNFIFYTLQTALTASYRTTHSSSSVVTTRQYLWNEYDANVFFFQIAPANFQLSSRQYTTDIRTDYQGIRSRGGTRNRQDRAGLALVRVPFLPLVNFSYQRTKSWSIIGEPYENRSNQYTFSASSRNGSDGYATVIGSLSEFTETSSSFYERIFTLKFDGSRTLTEGHLVTVGSEFYKYGQFSALSGGGSYGGRLAENLLLTSGIGGQRATGRNYTIQAFTSTHSVQWAQDEHFRYSASLSGGTGATVNRLGPEVRRTDTRNWSGSTSVTHSRKAAGVNFNNNLSLAYGERTFLDRTRFYRVGINNSANRSVGSFALNAAYNFSYYSNRNGYSWNSTDHYAILSATGTLPASIRSRSSVDFRSYSYGGDMMTASDQSSLNMSQTLSGSFRHVIPFTLGAGASAHYFFVGLRGRTYGYHASFQSSRFFTDGLYASYRYTRSYDPYYRRESLEHSASFSYRWRLLSFQLTLHERTVFNTMRDVRFSVERSL